MKIQDWFDPHNIEHVKAYKHLTHEGVWPEGFVPEHATFDLCWIVAIAAKLANAWVAFMIDQDYVESIP